MMENEEASSLPACNRCRRKTRKLDQDTGLCTTCLRVVMRPIAPCQRCGKTRTIFNQSTGLCDYCDGYTRWPPKREALRVKRPCSICGKLRSSAVLGRDICFGCYLFEQNGQGVCADCGQEKPIFYKRGQLCKWCYEERRASADLRRYVEQYETPYPYNKALFDLLASIFEPNQITGNILRQVQAFGRFLQHHPFEEPLTWDGIEAARQSLQSYSSAVANRISASLYTIGNVLASQGKIESRENYLAHRCWHYAIAQAPEPIRQILQQHVEWLKHESLAPKTITNSLNTLAAFWNWCWQRHIYTPQEVDAEVIIAFDLTLHRQWRCRACRSTVPFDPAQRTPPNPCPLCQSDKGFNRSRRYRISTINEVISTLRRFFNWAVVNKLVHQNPVMIKNPTLVANIQHYSPKAIERLCAYLISPEADPTEALVLYLIIFHACSTWELNHVQLPSVASDSNGVPLSLADQYHVILPARQPSAGALSPGRAPGAVMFHPTAATWLKPLLERYERLRTEIMRNPENRYLFVAPQRTRHNLPSTFYTRSILQCATERVLGAACQPNVLRKTVGLMIAEEHGGAILQRLGWDGQQAYLYTQPVRREIPLPAARRKRKIKT